VLGVLGRLLTLAGEVELALDYLVFARKQNPNYSLVHYALALANLWAGRPDEALSSATHAFRLSPCEPLTSMFLTLMSFSHFLLGDLETAESTARQAIVQQPREGWARAALAVALIERGDVAQARTVVREALRINPKLSARTFDAIDRFAPEATRGRVAANLGTAGLPD
jgi:Flp pilus assembly protein TadD